MEEGLQRQRDTGKTPVRKELAGRQWGQDPGDTCLGASAACRAWAGHEGPKAGLRMVLRAFSGSRGPLTSLLNKPCSHLHRLQASLPCRGIPRTFGGTPDTGVCEIRVSIPSTPRASPGLRCPRPGES